VTLLTRNADSVTQRYGAYVRAVAGDVGDAAAVSRALRGCTACLVTAELGCLATAAAAAASPPHVVLMSRAARSGGGPLAALLQSSSERVRGDMGREAALRAAAPPFTILRLGAEVGKPGGRPLLVSSQPGSVSGAVSVEDGAAVAAVIVGLTPCGATVEVVEGDAAGAGAAVAALPAGARETWPAALGVITLQ